MQADRETSPRPLPAFLKKFFWEVDFEKFQLPDQENYVVERLLEYGNDDAIRWVRNTFPREAIMEVVRNSAVISKRTANLWALVFGIPRDKIRCFSKRSILPHGSFSGN